MNLISTFDSTKESLLTLMQGIKSGKTQLPDFQRGWVWSDSLIKSLLSSVSLSYPIGTIMMLQTSNQGIRFKPRLVEGVKLPSHVQDPEPEWLVLDGQQRLTSLFLALYSKHVVKTKDTRGKSISRWYYLDICKSLGLSGDQEDSIVSLPENKCIRNVRGDIIIDCSTTEMECKAEFLPLPLIFDVPGLTSWQMEYLKDRDLFNERLNRWNNLQTVIQRFQQYQVPLILLNKETPKEAICQVFEKVNTGGEPLNVFELLTATYAAENFNLREDWQLREQRLYKHSVLRSTENTDFLQTVALLATRARRMQKINEGESPDTAPGVSCRRRDTLELELTAYKAWADQATEGLEKAAKLLFEHKIFDARDLPYKSQLIPLAAILAVLGNNADNDGVRRKIMRWYWCGVFGELYGSAGESRIARDLQEVLSWIEKDRSEPSTVSVANFSPSRLLTLKSRTSAAYKGIHALILKAGGMDFRTGITIQSQEYFDEKVDIHHIFPQDWCKKNSIDPDHQDCIVNKTVLSAKTNRIIGNQRPSVYLVRIQKDARIDDARLSQILHSHLIDITSLKADDFTGFFKKRERALLKYIRNAMGSPTEQDIKQLQLDTYNEFSTL